jgi:hypothetical protein
MDEIHRITASGLSGPRAGDAGDRRCLLPSAPPEREPFVAIINPFHLLMVDRPAFPPYPRIDPGTPLPPLALGKLADPHA